MTFSLFELALLSVDSMLLMLIALVQWVIYPSFRNMESRKFAEWHAGYMRRITFFVGPTMISQVLLIGWLGWQHWEITDGKIDKWLVGSLAGVGVAWLATAIGAAPIHTQLSAHGQSAKLISRLLVWNGIRVGAWLLVWMLDVARLIFRA